MKGRRRRDSLSESHDTTMKDGNVSLVIRQDLADDPALDRSSSLSPVQTPPADAATLRKSPNAQPPNTVPSSTRPRRGSWLWSGHQKPPSRDLGRPWRDPGQPSLGEDFLPDSHSAPSRSSTPRRPSTSSFSHFLSFQSSRSSESCTQQVYPSASGSNGGLVPPTRPEAGARTTGSFGKMALNSMIGGLTSLSLSRSNTNNDDKDKESRGRSSPSIRPRSSSFGFPASSKDKDKDRDRDAASVISKQSLRARSQSPFSLRRFRSHDRDRDRDHSPTPLPLEESDSESILSRRSLAVRPQNAFTDDGDSGSERDDTEDEEDSWSDEDGMFDFVTERNTEQNAQIAIMAGGEVDGDGDVDGAMDPDPLGEGVNVVVPPEPYFPTTLNRPSFGSARGKRGMKRRKSKHHELLPHNTSRPLFQRDRCTITVTQGHPQPSGSRKRRYIVASDLSDESRYAVEWGIGTVLRDGDELLIITVVENENKVDPLTPNPADRATKLRSQQERQALAYILLRQATSLLQRTRLQVSVSCQAWHAKNARHMLLDIVDHIEPTMLIVGSRGIGQLKGVLLGSTSHYLIQRCSVPVMVARRRLKRPPKRSAHLAKHRVHVSLAEAGIDRVAPKVDHAVAVMRDEMQREDKERDDPSARGIVEAEGEEGEGDGEGEGDADGEDGGEGIGDSGEGEGFLRTKLGS